MAYELPFHGGVVNAFRYVIGSRLSEAESLEDAIAGGVFLGTTRAQMLERPLWPVDVEMALSIWSLWWFQLELPEDQEHTIRSHRPTIFRGAALGDVERLALAVPTTTLAMSLETVCAVQQSGSALALLNLPV